MSKFSKIKQVATSKAGVAGISVISTLALVGGGLGVAASNGTLEDIVNQISGRVKQTEVKTEELDTRVTVLETEVQKVKELTPKVEEPTNPEPAPEPVEPEPTPTPQPEAAPTQPVPVPEPKSEPEPMPEPAYTNADLIALARQHAKQGDAVIDFEDEKGISVRYNEQRKRILFNSTANGGQGGWFWGNLYSDLDGVDWSSPMPHNEAVAFLTSI
jgi:type IV secretory pathway VirB10-like protein